MVDSITTALGVGTGIDTKTLVADLVAAQFDPKTKVLAAKNETLTAQISALAQLKSGITSFSNALATLVAGGSLATQPASADPTIVTAKALPGAKAGGFAAELEVRQLAASQLLTSAPFASRSAEVGTGSLVLTFGTTTFTGDSPTGFTADATRGPVTVTIGEGENSLAGLASAINAANAGVTASIVADAGGAALSIRGQNGDLQSFTITATEDAAKPGLAAFAFAPGSATLAIGRKAQDSIVAVDGIAVRRPTNLIDDLVPGAQLTLVKAELGKTVSLSAVRPTASIGQAVNDFVAAFNELRSILKTETDPATGKLSGDAGARSMARQLGSLTSVQLVTSAPAGAPKTLAEIGVRTGRDGTLSVDSALLNKALATWPDAVEAMFDPVQSSDNPLLNVTSAPGRAKPGTYDIADVTLATAGTLSGLASPTAFDTPLVVDATNRRLSIAVDGGAAVDLDLIEASYADGAAYAQAINAAIGANAATAGKASVTWSGDRLVVTSTAKGGASAVTLTALDATLADRVGLTGAVATAGVAPSATIAGKPALAIGAFLFAATDSAAAGLILQPFGNVTSARITIDLGLTQALADIATRLTASSDGLGASSERYAKQQADIAKSQAKTTGEAEKMRERLTRQFATTESRVAAYKNTQSFLDQQVKMWSQSNG